MRSECKLQFFVRICDCGYMVDFGENNYRKVSNIRRTKSQNLDDSHLVFQLSLFNRFKPGVKSRMKM